MRRATEASGLSNAAIGEYAEKVGVAHGLFASQDCADLEGLVSKLGGTVEVSRSFFSEEALTVNSPGDFTIHLPPMTSFRRDRFTIAHELGHYFLHYRRLNLTGPADFGRGSRNRAETEANVFAASLLMPKDRFIKIHRECGGDSEAIASKFGVSPLSVDVRCQVLGL